MDQRELDRVWDRARRGLPTVVLDRIPADAQPPEDLLVMRVRCDVPPRPLGPLLDAAARAARALGEPPPRLDAEGPALEGARGRMLEPSALAEPRALAAIVATLNRLARRAPRGALVLVFDQLAAADDATVVALRAALARPGWLAAPLVLALGTRGDTRALAPLLEAALARGGEDAVVRLAPRGADGEADEAAWREAFARLPADVKLTLRAASLIGAGFEPATVAALRNLAPARVLEHLQQAADEGIAVEDAGAHHVHLPGAMVDALRGSILPSLARAWHNRLAQLLVQRDEGVLADDVAAPPQLAAPHAAQPAPPPSRLDADPPVRRAAPRVRPFARSRATSAHLAAAGPGTTPRMDPRPAYGDLFEASPEATGARVPPPVVPAPTPAVATARATRGEAAGIAAAPPPPPADEARTTADGGASARAAEHLIASGEYEAAAEHLAAAALEAAEMGLPVQALAYGRRALETLGRLPDTDAQRQLRVEILCALGELQCQAAGPGADFTLGAALETLERARAILSDGDPAELRAQVSALLAAVRYELGDLRSLSAALDELTDATRVLATAGDALGAARLLNDQAAVYVRLGDPVRAAYLLGESRRVFEDRAERGDPRALFELAETDHLFARLPLHAAARPGREAEALEAARRHAAAAEQIYRRLGAGRELARVWETVGRLELRAGRLDRAEERLAAAVQAQESLGDVLGLARSSAAMSDALARAGRLDDALRLQGTSVAFNLEKGSPIGLAYNRRALERLASAAHEAGAHEGHRALLEQLTAAEQIVGRAELRTN